LQNICTSIFPRQRLKEQIMSLRNRVMPVLGVAVLVISAGALQAAAPINGRWITADKSAVVEIAPCGTNLCGRVAKFLVAPPQGADQKDVNNPNKALRGRTILGMNILTGFKADGEQWRGQIYDPKAGKTYRSVVYKGVSGNLIVKGCVGPFCKTQTWTQAR
jgi:uncharacterized protein (DUF2147 family)